MLNKQNLLYKFMKQTKKYDVNDIIYLETSELLSRINYFLVFLPLFVQCIIRLIYIIYYDVSYYIFDPDYEINKNANIIINIMF